MSVSIYLNNIEVQIVQGSRGNKGSFQDSVTVNAPEGSIINGTITDSAAFVDFLKEIWAYLQDRYPDRKKELKQLFKSKKLYEYENAAASLFR